MRVCEHARTCTCQPSRDKYTHRRCWLMFRIIMRRASGFAPSQVHLVASCYIIEFTTSVRISHSIVSKSSLNHVLFLAPAVPLHLLCHIFRACTTTIMQITNYCFCIYVQYRVRASFVGIDHPEFFHLYFFIVNW